MPATASAEALKPLDSASETEDLTSVSSDTPALGASFAYNSAPDPSALRVNASLDRDRSLIATPPSCSWSQALALYWWGLFHGLRGGAYSGLRARIAAPQARLQVYWLALSLRLWHKPHYRSGTFKKDLLKNLRNVAVPKTGMPLSLVCCSRIVAYPFVVLVIPLLCLVAALVRRARDGVPLGRGFALQLLSPPDWFCLWRLNCVLASYHALVVGEEGYEMEDKLTFLEACEREGLPASPWLKLPKLICKHRNEEGGLGFAAFSNAVVGGDWIIQQSLDNSAEIARLLPANAPLSTLRLVTSSRASLKGATSSARPLAPMAADVAVLSACWRAGRAGATTDHSSVLFDVDLATGEIQGGTSNSHWYQRGLTKAYRCPWRSEGHTQAVHPDTGVPIRGQTIPEIGRIRQLVLDAHLLMCPQVPLVGWDVALTTEGMCLLEGNLSCNFFRASFDRDAYFSFAEGAFEALDAMAGPEKGGPA